jgi:hypothetical protein
MAAVVGFSRPHDEDNDNVTNMTAHPAEILANEPVGLAHPAEILANEPVGLAHPAEILANEIIGLWVACRGRNGSPGQLGKGVPSIRWLGARHRARAFSSTRHAGDLVR